MFRKGLEIYMNKFGYRTAEVKDLWRACSEATNSTKDIEVYVD